MIKNVIIFTVGAFVGALTASVIFKKKYEMIANEEIASVMDFTRRKTEPVSDEDKVVDFPRYKYSDAVSRYNTSEKSLLENAEDVNRFNNPMGIVRNEPYIISVEQFSEEMCHYDKITIYYYEDDQVLAEENEEIIDNTDYIIGDALEHFGEMSDDAEVVYVRNDRLAIDYDVIRLSKSYASTVGFGKE